MADDYSSCYDISDNAVFFCSCCAPSWTLWICEAALTDLSGGIPHSRIWWWSRALRNNTDSAAKFWSGGK